ncbi:MAG: CarD family transcriptional regulator [Lachnospiraceae bacterium]|nr:CarD family transcriptional regulator [Lachnospiraceae bacterium]
MFQIDEFVIHPTGGICRIEKIDSLEISGADQERKYYFLSQVKGRGSRVFVPVDMGNDVIRRVITLAEANELIDEIPSIGEASIENDKIRETKYKEAIKSCDCKELVSLLKNLYTRRSKRISEGKRNTATDEKYCKIAEDNLYGELAFALGIDKSEVHDLLAPKFDI